jgi:hypothetical protein
MGAHTTSHDKMKKFISDTQHALRRQPVQSSRPITLVRIDVLRNGKASAKFSKGCAQTATVSQPTGTSLRNPPPARSPVPPRREIA